MGKNTNRNILIVTCIAFLLLFSYTQGLFDPLIKPPIPPTEVKYSSFKWTGVCEDATGTSVTGSSSRLWYDVNGDEVMQYSELGTFTESSGVYTSDMEYPIGLSYDLWVQSYVASYQLTYAKFHMTGERNSDGSAKSVGQLEHRQTDDSLTWDGTMNGAAFDTTDYNYTLSGTTGILKAEFILSAADKGVSSQIWEDIDYMKAYGITKAHDYIVRWSEITEGINDAIVIADASIFAPTFFAAYCTVADKNEGAVDISSFDVNFSDGTNWYCIDFVSTSMGDLMYNTADSVAPRPYVSIPMGTITAAGTFVATYGIALWQNVTYDQMMAGSWTKGTTLALGTSGDGWAWAA